MDAHFINHSLYLKIILIHLFITISYKEVTKASERIYLSQVDRVRYQKNEK